MKIGVLTALGLVLSFNLLHAITITVDGLVTTPHSYNMPGFDITDGDPFRLVMTYGEPLPVDDSDGFVGKFQAPWEITVTAGAREFSAIVDRTVGESFSVIYVQDAPIGDSFVAEYDWLVSNPFTSQLHLGALNLSLQDPTGTALSSTDMPDSLNLSDWGGRSFSFGAGNIPGNESYGFRGVITAVSVPEPRTWLLLLAVVLVYFLRRLLFSR